MVDSVILAMQMRFAGLAICGRGCLWKVAIFYADFEKNDFNFRTADVTSKKNNLIFARCERTHMKFNWSA